MYGNNFSELMGVLQYLGPLLSTFITMCSHLLIISIPSTSLNQSNINKLHHYYDTNQHFSTFIWQYYQLNVFIPWLFTKQVMTMWNI